MAMVYSWLVVVVALACVLVAHGQEDVFNTAFRTNISFADLPPWAFEDGVAPVDSLKFEACPTLPAPADTDDVKNLRPGNIKIVMAMGDSITCGMSAKDTSILSMKEYRGLAYSIGGDSGVTTLPNLLKPYLATGYPIGLSTGVGSRTMATNGLNAAISGAINSDMMSQATWLVQQLKANTKININTDWKLLTIWIGSNNLCDVCDNANNNNGNNFETQLTNALQYLYINVPRLFVNLVANLEISTMYNINSGACGLLHSIACGCVGSSNANNRALVASTGKDYVARAYTIAQRFTNLNNQTFAVVVQPFLTQTVITERAQLSAADCFHPSAPSHQVAAIALWNNLFTPAATKKHAWVPSDVPICPTADTLLYTY